MAITPKPQLVATSTQSGGLPPDTQMAVSGSRRFHGQPQNEYVVISTNAFISVYKKDGTLLSSQSKSDFFKSLTVDDGSDNAVTNHALQWDGRVLYDHYRQRFWVLQEAGNGKWMKKDGSNWSQVRGRLYVAVSKTEDPTGDWWRYVWDAAYGWGDPSEGWQPGDIADHPSIGIGPSTFLVAILNVNQKTYDAGQTPKPTHVILGDANALANGNPNAVVAHRQLGVLFVGGFTGIAEPAIHYGPTDSIYLVGRTGTQELLIWKFLCPPGVSPAEGSGFSYVLLGGMPFQDPTDAPQKGSAKLIKMSNSGTAPLGAVYRNHKLHVVCHDARDWFNDGRVATAIRLVRLDMSTYPTIPVSKESGCINRVFGRNTQTPPADQPTDVLHYGWPAVAVNSHGDMLVAYTRSGPTIYPEARVSAYYAAEGDIRQSNILKSGEGPYTGGFRWGDTTGACVDPIDGTTFWVANQYAQADGAYGIAIGKELL